MPQAAGSATDNVARTLAPELSKQLGQNGELFKYMTGTDIVHIPYKGGAPAIADLIAGNVQLMFESTNSIAQRVRNGRVRALAVSGPKRSISLPEVPTLVEAGVPGYEVNLWSGVIAPAGLPRPILDRLNKAINAAIVEPQTHARFAQLGSEGGGGTPEAFAELIRRDSAKWADVVRRFRRQDRLTFHSPGEHDEKVRFSSLDRVVHSGQRPEQHARARHHYLARRRRAVGEVA